MVTAPIYRGSRRRTEGGEHLGSSERLENYQLIAIHMDIRARKNFQKVDISLPSGGNLGHNNFCWRGRSPPGKVPMASEMSPESYASAFFRSVNSELLSESQVELLWMGLERSAASDPFFADVLAALEDLPSA